MRFFRPALSPFVFSIESQSIKKICVSDDLTVLTTCSIDCAVAMRKVFSALKQSSKDLPPATTLSRNKSVFQMDGLCDVTMELSQVANQIRAENPSFFTDLSFYEKCLQSNLVDNPPSVDDFISSELHMRYFQLQSLRREGVQHTIEFPLKSLTTNGLLSQKDLHQIVSQVWLRTSAIRKEKKAVLAKLPATVDPVPYVFRMR